jgi:hypothetical protein
MLRKKLFIVCAVLACCLLAFSCGTPKLVATFDESVPLEKSSWISTSFLGEIKSYNGIPVNWKGPDAITVEMIQIPAGQTVLEWNIEVSAGGVTAGDVRIKYMSRINGALFTYNFLPGKQYMFHYEPADETPGLHVFEFNINEKIPVSYAQNRTNFVSFVPFSNIVKN